MADYQVRSKYFTSILMFLCVFLGWNEQVENRVLFAMISYMSASAQGTDANADCHIYCHVTDQNRTEYYADCSYRNLTQLPKLPRNVTQLVVSLNLVGNLFTNLTEVPWQNFKSLRNLSLARNNFEELENGSFTGLSNLEVLDLSLNYIRYTRISEDSFKSLKRLKYLDLKQNFHDIWDNETFPRALKYLEQLKILQIDGIDSGTGTFPYMPNLTELYLSGEYGRCNISYLHEAYFNDLPITTLEHLYISNCSIQRVASDAFESMQNLSSLDLARNTQLGIRALPNISYGLWVNKKIKRLNVNSLYDYINYEFCSSLNVEFMKNLNDTGIELLTMEKNYFVRMDPAGVDYFASSLKYLSISDNMFMFGKYIKRLIEKDVMRNLIYFDTSKMYKTHIPTGTLLKRRKFDTVDITPSISNVCLGDDSFRNLVDSMLTRKHIIDDFEDILNKMKRYGIKPTSSVDVHSSDEKYNVGGKESDRHNSHQVKQPHLYPETKLQFLDLSENLPGTIYMALEIFNNTPDIIFLNASNNYLGYPLLNDTSSNLFESVKNLRILDLSNNRITKLMPNIFRNMTGLEELLLSHNSLSGISFNLDPLQALKYLDLSNNHVTTLEESVRVALSKLTNVTVNMAHNPIQCSCKDETFVTWVHENKHKFERLEDTFCTLDNSTSTSFRELNFDQYKYKCSPPQYHTIILVASLCILTSVIVVSCGLVYRFKWNLRYLYYMAKFKLIDGYQPIIDKEYEKEVFVSYSNEDGGFVHDHIALELETKGDISLLIHDRDFRAGEFVADNILRAITSTRRTLVILTAAYIRSKWCMYELNMARMEAADTGRNVLCVVLKEDIPMKYLPLEVINIIKDKTYIEFPTKEEHMPLFWERLRATLNHGECVLQQIMA